MANAFRLGDAVEVIGSKHGYIGSFYEATITGIGMSNYYEVEYLIVIDGGTGALYRDILPTTQLLRPPTSTYRESYAVGEVVNVWTDQGWWVGVIDRKSVV